MAVSSHASLVCGSLLLLSLDDAEHNDLIFSFGQIIYQKVKFSRRSSGPDNLSRSSNIQETSL
jgi:hypothetical protein